MTMFTPLNASARVPSVRSSRGACASRGALADAGVYSPPAGVDESISVTELRMRDDDASLGRRRWRDGRRTVIVLLLSGLALVAPAASLASQPPLNAARGPV